MVLWIRRFSAAAALVSLFSMGNAATRYVDALNGDDRSVGGPWKTIQKAATASLAGDTIIVQAGNYPERIQVSTAGAAGAPITFQAQGAVKTRGFTVETNYVRILGFEITNAISEYPDGVGVYVKGHDNEVSGNTIHDLFYEGIYLDGGSLRNSPGVHDNLIKGNRIYRAQMCGIDVEGVNNTIEQNDISHTIQFPLGWPPGKSYRPGSDADGMRFFGSDHKIRGNYIHDILLSDQRPGDAPHIDCFQCWGPASNILFEKNTCRSDSQRTLPQPIELQVAMIENSDGQVTGLTFRNNLFFDATRGINMESRTATLMSNFVFVHNTFKNLDEQAILLSNAPNAKVQNNLFYNVAVGGGSHYLGLKDSASRTNLQAGYNARYETGQTPGGTPYPHDLWQIDPQLENITANNFHLRSTSPLIDAGLAQPGLTEDFDGKPRPSGSGPDIGAFEFQSGEDFPPARPRNLRLNSR